LEEGLQPYLSLKRREHSFKDRTRADVLLEDGNGDPVVVECKQGTPSLNDLRQLRGYMRKVRQLTGRNVRGILVHGGIDRLPTELRRGSRLKPTIEIIRYKYTVEFPSAT
jgi:RecB family endonuclease NucS